MPRHLSSASPSFLLIGPYDPECGEYTFLAPPLGVWRLAGVLQAGGVDAFVFDPNCCDESPEQALAALLRQRRFDVIGVSTTGMTLRYDLALAHLARRLHPEALLVAGGMEATFKPERLFELCPFDLVVLGEGERPLLEIAERLRARAPLDGVAGTAWPTADGGVERHHQPALPRDEMVAATLKTPYAAMPYPRYWQRLESAYRVGALPHKAAREARLAEIRSVRLNTLNYCPMACTFCSSTNFLHAAQGGVARVVRLEADECLTMIERIVAVQPEVRTIIFQDDIFVFVNDARILPLCAQLMDAKRSGRLPADLQFISTNRIDSMTAERLKAMQAAGFRVLGFGVESFSPAILAEFNKARIYRHIEPVLRQALALGITPFLDIILTSPRCALADVGETARSAFDWIRAGCEVGIYPYVIPFSGAVMAGDATLAPFTEHRRYRIGDTSIHFEQAIKILPVDDQVRDAILTAEGRFLRGLALLEGQVAHLPSRVRSLLWLASLVPELERCGEAAPAVDGVLAELFLRLPLAADSEQACLRHLLSELVSGLAATA